jgi:hypothetical protein
MNRNPIDVALQHVNETMHLLDALITSSESFDYNQAKQALAALQKKSRALGKLRSELLADIADAPQYVLAFPSAALRERTNPASAQ